MTDSRGDRDKDIVMSPCVSMCCLDEDDVCIGCYRSGKEIASWGKLDNDGKRDVLKKVSQRMAGKKVE